MLSKDYPRNTWRFTNNGILTSRERTTVYLHNIIINNDIRYEQISKGNDYRPANFVRALATTILPAQLPSRVTSLRCHRLLLAKSLNSNAYAGTLALARTFVFYRHIPL